MDDFRKFQERYQAPAQTIACYVAGCKRHGSWTYLPGGWPHAYCDQHIDWTKCCDGEYGRVYPYRLPNKQRKIRRLLRRAYRTSMPRYQRIRTSWYQDEDEGLVVTMWCLFDPLRDQTDELHYHGWVWVGSWGRSK